MFSIIKVTMREQNCKGAETAFIAAGLPSCVCVVDCALIKLYDWVYR